MFIWAHTVETVSLSLVYFVYAYEGIDHFRIKGIAPQKQLRTALQTQGLQVLRLPDLRLRVRPEVGRLWHRPCQVRACRCRLRR